MKKYFYLVVTLFAFNMAFGQGNSSDWNIEYTKSKSFIENNGQFDQYENESTGKIKYAVDFGFSRIFFGKKGVSYSFLQIKKKSREERKAIMNSPSKTFEDHKQKEELIGKHLIKKDEVNMSWDGINPNVELVGTDVTNDTHGYSYTNSKGESVNVSGVKAFEKIVYKNIYPNIDVEYVVHPQVGVKYAFIVHPGADASKLKMLFDREFSLENEEVHVSTMFGDIVDHAPITFYENNKENIIESKYQSNGKELSFYLGSYDKSRTIVIDPWVQTPNDPNSNWNCVWELDKDGAGNVYVIAGIMPMQLLKYDATGVLQWTHNTPYDTTAWLGTMATDNVGNTYVTNGTSYEIQKVNTLGGVVWNNPNPAGGQISTEFWNISFNCDETKLLVGGTGGNLDIHGKVYDVDMNSGNINASVQVTQAGNLFSIPPNLQEVRAMCPSPSGKYYFVTLDTIGYLSDNLTLCPNGTSSLVMDDHGIGWGYKSEDWRYNNTGIKAIRADANFVYINRGNELQKRSLQDFSIVGTANIPGGVLNAVFLGGNQSQNAGIDIDDCGNIYVGSKTGVYAFNSALTQIGFYPTTFKVWDVRVSTSGDVIACGGTGDSGDNNRSGSVQSFAAAACAPMAFTCCNASVCIPEEMCEADAPITLTPASAGGTWSGTGVDASGTFDPAIAGSGVHNITYTLLCGSETISITVNPCATIEICEEANGDLTASGGNGTYTWYEGAITASTTPITSEQECIDCPSATPQYIPFFGIYDGCDLSDCPTMDTVWTQYDTGVTTSPLASYPVSYPIQIVDGVGITVVINSAAEIAACANNPCGGVTITMNVDSQSDPSCFGGSNGTATVSATGGSSPYSYIWTPGSLSGDTQSSLSAGTYSVAVQDNAGCIGSGSVTIGEPTELIASAVSTPAACGANDGTATGSAVGGTGGYTYSWSPSGGSNALATGLAPNTYTVTVTDANMCTDDAVVNVTTTTGPTIAIDNSTDVNCFGGNDGTATVSATGGTGAYTYSWMPGSLTGDTQSALTADSYTVTVTDASGCTDVIVVDILEPTELIASAVSTPATCGANDGTATGSAVGGTGGYTYSWSPSGGTNALATGLAANTYTVTVTDANMCTDDAVVSVTTTTGPTIALDNSTDVNCFGGNDGTATVSATGGTGAYTYSWIPGPLTGDTQAALTADSYTVTVTDASGCTDAIVVDIQEPTELVASAVSTPASCGANDGTATGSAVGGTGGYTYSWSPSGGTNALATGLGPNTYTVTITDANMCTDDAVVNVTTTTGPTIALDNSTDVNCFGGNDGTATVSATGGTGAYTYSWMPGSLTGDTQSALTADSYTVTVTDASGCTDVIVVDILEPTQMVLGTSNIVDANCGANDGAATVDVTGGTSTYTYDWSPVGGTGATATNIPGGAYAVTVTDANMCVETINFTVPTLGGPTLSVVSTTDVSCNGLADGEGIISATGGSTPYVYSWSPSGGSNDVATGLTAGTYTVTVTDAGSCVSTIDVTINEPTAIVISETVVDEDCGQANGSVSLSVSGGTPTYTYAWLPGGETTSSITGLAGGGYSVTVTDGAGCTATGSYTVATIGSLPVVATPNFSIIDQGESVQLDVTGATTYSWTPATGLSCDDCPDPIASPSVSTVYIVTGTDANGCFGIDTVEILVTAIPEDCGTVYVPDIFSPNSDLNNDYLCVYGDCISELKFAVYNRWGELVFETTSTINSNLGNENEICWDGTYKGKPLNSGVYAYKIYAKLFDDTVKEESGNITLVR